MLNRRVDRRRGLWHLWCGLICFLLQCVSVDPFPPLFSDHLWDTQLLSCKKQKTPAQYKKSLQLGQYLASSFVPLKRSVTFSILTHTNKGQHKDTGNDKKPTPRDPNRSWLVVYNIRIGGHRLKRALYPKYIPAEIEWTASGNLWRDGLLWNKPGLKRSKNSFFYEKTKWQESVGRVACEINLSWRDKNISFFYLEVKTSITAVKEKKEATQPFDLNNVGSTSASFLGIYILGKTSKGKAHFLLGIARIS